MATVEVDEDGYDDFGRKKIKARADKKAKEVSYATCSPPNPFPCCVPIVWRLVARDRAKISVCTMSSQACTVHRFWGRSGCTRKLTPLSKLETRPESAAVVNVRVASARNLVTRPTNHATKTNRMRPWRASASRSGVECWAEPA